MQPSVTVVVVCYNEQSNIAICLDSILDQDLPEQYRVLIVDGGSTDDTLAIVDRYRQNCRSLEVAPNLRRHVTAGRNVGWQHCSTPLIAFTDADCVVPRHWLRTLCNGYHHYQKQYPNLVAIGSGNYPPENSPFYQIIALFTTSPFGNRRTAQTELYQNAREVPHCPTLNVLYVRQAIADIKGFDSERFRSVGEDEDLSVRLRKNGGCILYLPGAEVLHRQKANLKAWSRNMWLYGYGRMNLMYCHRELMRERDFLPFLLPLALALLPFSALANFLALPFLIYLFFFLIYSLYHSLRHNKGRLFLLLFSVFFCSHLCYALGMLKYLVGLAKKNIGWHG